MQTSSRKDRKYSILPYQEHWREDFDEVAKAIAPIFGGNIIDIVHVGSTAIVGI